MPELLDVSALTRRIDAFPSPELVQSAASMFASSRVTHPLGARRSAVLDEGPRSFVTIGPGVVQVGRNDFARAERTAERLTRRRFSDVELLAVEVDFPGAIARARADARELYGSSADLSAPESVTALQEWELLADARDSLTSRGKITSWSPKSRSNMRKVLGQLDYGPMVEAEGTRGMVTLTYPGEWLAVAPDSATCKRHVDELKRRFKRAWSVPMVGLWKREFQRRGAPHYHLLVTVPSGTVLVGRGPGARRLGFREWLSETWADVVGAQWCGVSCWQLGAACCERGRHVEAGTGVDFAEGLRASDPRRVAAYFSKHGVFAAKDYQNQAPAEWLGEDGTGAVGRFWGVWGLDKALAVVEVAPEHGVQAGRLLRRLSRSQGPVHYFFTPEGHKVRRAAGPQLQRVPVWRKVTTVDRETGELGWKWRRRWVTRRVRHLRSDSGYLVVNDGPAVAASMARYLGQL